MIGNDKKIRIKSKLTVKLFYNWLLLLRNRYAELIDDIIKREVTKSDLITSCLQKDA